MVLQRQKSNKSVDIPHFRGSARKVNRRTEPGKQTITEVAIGGRSSSYTDHTQILEFRLEITDQSGNIVSSKQVVLEGKKIYGVICEGDEVEVFGKEGESGIEDPFRVFNLSTETEITVNRRVNASRISPDELAIIIFAVFVGFFFLLIVLAR